jgi:hypothetical protein
MMMRSVYRLAGLAKRYGPAAAEAACARALDVDVINVSKIESMLVNATEKNQAVQAAAPAGTECVRYFVRGGFSLSGSGCLSVTIFSRYLMPCCPVYPAVPRNRTFRAVPGLMLRVPVFPASCAVAGACCLILRGSHGGPFPSVIKYSRR